MAAAEKVVPFMLDAEDIDVLRTAISRTLDLEAKSPAAITPRRVRLYRLNRRLYRARLKLER